ncbi:hypothetical protein QC764_407110 [Podospora pseudoanserina]|uniref:Uncharacterized protein n=1 Tax=Podospora pseudoanserina TaxID=2609844 RepID=A0ABR0IAR0_9PEZI|nr:hypothetical protein QC764_407110 [Podospora pseudoanserina]
MREPEISEANEFQGDWDFGPFSYPEIFDRRHPSVFWQELPDDGRPLTHSTSEGPSSSASSLSTSSHDRKEKGVTF